MRRWAEVTGRACALTGAGAAAASSEPNNHRSSTNVSSEPATEIGSIAAA